ncbi:hypothetical protein MKA27_13415 [[Clostridium] innocuum]|uniref:hypothetical protein n=1 Tax=Clostridium innocuum TaxID=1522 RepID=UPI000D6C33A4|nr:hypothetical protein [[Clostridium] innocuum]MCR0317591.1 hypothetical protein [[Clostridium] innocuum]MCR0374819.1 hypothetical protein [[Clostridium] innocuum]MCR0604673.1 hypothetical protein [[Clostridium] innocuum]PWJ12756.1 hypothetical protein ATF84_1136 [[Clostridium] innocuum]SSA47122.1 hypothetical protein SAMN04487929_1136 [[Clostridium] innocuum]
MSEKETEIKKNDVDNKEKKGKKSDKAIVVGLVVALLGGVAYGGYKAYEYFKPFNIEDKISSLKKDAGDDGRVFDHLDVKAIKDKLKDYDFSAELNKEPYKNSVVDGMNIYEAGSSGKNSFSELYKNGEFEFWTTSASLRHPDDEKVDPNQTDSFNSFSSALFALDRVENKKLSDKEVQTWAENAEAMALKQHSPAYFYIKDLILNLKGKNPTTASVYYLMIANRIKPDMLTEELSYNITDNSKYLDTSYKDKKKEKSLVKSWDTDFEYINNKSAIIHEFVDGSLTQYAIADKVLSRNSLYKASSEAEDHFVKVLHYKDISKMMIAEYAIIPGNNDAQASGISSGMYSAYKPAFTWCISPKIEKICSQYYDIVEPMVYNGTFTSRKDVINQMVKKYKYSYDEVMTAVLTYEYWALG